MFAVTLLTSPVAPSLEAPLVTALCQAWGGGDIRWLAPREAAEFMMPVLPNTADTVWADLQAQGIDMIVQPQAGRRKAMLLADMDSTLIQQECIDELAAEVGVGPHVAAITARAMNGELEFEAALDERVALLAGQPEGIIARVLATRITYMPGGRTLLATMTAAGAHTALVSGGFTAFTGPVAAALGFAEHHANTLEVANGHLTGTVARPILGREAKLAALHAITAQQGLTPADVLAVGDGMNDLMMLQAAGTGVALHGKPALQALCRVRVNHGDLTALLFLQGYARADFLA